MKKTIYIFFILICLIFVLPSILTKKRRAVSSNDDSIINGNSSTSTENNQEKYVYSNYATIKLYHTKTGEIEELPIDTYLYGVVSSEMPASYEMEALKAQAIVARTYTIYQISHSPNKHGEADICDSYDCCQAWISKEERLEKWDEAERDSNWRKIVESVDSTQGKVVTYNGEPIDAFFHSNSGGITETSSSVWGGSNLPYLQSVETSGEDGYSQYSSEVEVSYEELLNKLKEKKTDITINFENENDIRITEYTESRQSKKCTVRKLLFCWHRGKEHIWT